MRELVVDGYNAIYAWPMLRPLADSGRMEDARTCLIGMLAEYGAATGVDVTVVFDSHQRSGAAQSERIDGVTVRWGTKLATADHVIERMAFMATREGPDYDIIVATTDRLQRDLVMSMGVGVMTTLELCTEVRRAAAGTQARVETQRRQASATNRIEERLDTRTRNRLERMRRGSGGENTTSS